MKADGGTSVGSSKYPAISLPSTALPSFLVVVTGSDAAATATAEHVEQVMTFSCSRKPVTSSGSYLGEID